MTKLDWIIVAVAAFMAFTGYRRGLVRMALGFAGLAVGAVGGARLAPHLLHHTAASHYSALVGLGGAIVGALVLQTAAGLAGGPVRTGLRFAPPLRLFDSLAGLAVGAATGFALAWVAGAVAVQVPGHPGWVRQVHRSHVIRRLNQIAPPKDVLRLRASLLERLP